MLCRLHWTDVALRFCDDKGVVEFILLRCLLIVSGLRLRYHGGKACELTGYRVLQWSKTLHLSTRGGSAIAGTNPDCIISRCDWESCRAVHNWPSVVLGLAVIVNKNVFFTDLPSFKKFEQTMQISQHIGCNIYICPGLASSVILPTHSYW